VIPGRDLSALPLEAASTLGGGSRLVLGATRNVVRRALQVAFGPPGAAQTGHPATVTIYSTSRDG